MEAPEHGEPPLRPDDLERPRDRTYLEDVIVGVVFGGNVIATHACYVLTSRSPKSYSRPLSQVSCVVVSTGWTGRVPRGRPKNGGFRDHENQRFLTDLTPRLFTPRAVVLPVMNLSSNVWIAPRRDIQMTLAIGLFRLRNVTRLYDRY